MLGSENVKRRFSEIMGGKAAGFTSSVLSVVGNNSLLQKAEPQSVLNSAVIAATLDLPVNSNLGYSAIVPYNDRHTGKCTAQFQLMYKGLIELCQRSGQFKTMIDNVVYEGEMVNGNRFTGEYEFDPTCRKSDKVIGYMAYFKLLNGFEKFAYMDVEEVQKHAQKYSQTYKSGYGVWKDNFDVMARKTVLKLLLSKYAPKSIEMQRGIVFDQAVVKGDLITEGANIDDAEVEYVDNDKKDGLAEMAEKAAITDKEK